MTLYIDKIFKKELLSNSNAVMILVSVSVTSNYFALAYPFSLNPYLVCCFLLFYSLFSYFASYFLQRVSDETRL